MAFPKVEQDVVIEKLMELFRSVGYDGASLSQIAQATGLQKASLYHRFPGGKQAMAEAVLDQVAEWSRANITDVLTSSAPPADRLNKALAHITDLYDGGRKGCILRALSLGNEATVFQPQIGRLFQDWIAGFEQLGLDLGLSPDTARRLAYDVPVRIQGALVVAVTLNQPKLFTESVQAIKNQYLNA
ncbi:TetR/AcrR family transcriptional regulator [Fibrisoma montanum]|uniref:TetR/AcrR family transcriptional regulator n=1 Tax=Fibrisoma montanum TaxID=2305895 RepID=A0A418M5K0_9BACT|nr:TetR/AcrR family transcriptional regulator [Fibrisoma montanum]RIV21143.1 TetR/AcrR family transcriptional regulator [Fibrisoma montanum]